MSKEQPLILVFYMDRATLSQQDIMKIISNEVKKVLDVKEVNAITFFVPTEDKERVECINPVIATRSFRSHSQVLMSPTKTCGFSRNYRI